MAKWQESAGTTMVAATTATSAVFTLRRSKCTPDSDARLPNYCVADQGLALRHQRTISEAGGRNGLTAPSLPVGAIFEMMAMNVSYDLRGGPLAGLGRRFLRAVKKSRVNSFSLPKSSSMMRQSTRPTARVGIVNFNQSRIWRISSAKTTIACSNAVGKAGGRTHRVCSTSI